MRCPSLDDITGAVLALLPRGRAWQTNEGGPFPPESDDDPAVLWRYWRSFSAVMDFLTQRLCALRLEFRCQTLSETRDGWLTEYGLPDDCDPFPDLCTKVAAIGGTRCEYYAEIAARAGWDIECVERIAFCGTRMGAAGALMGRARVGRTLGVAELRIVVHLPSSPSWQPSGRYLPALMGRLRTGRRLTCGPALAPLKCVLSRVIHAEILTVYEVSNVA